MGIHVRCSIFGACLVILAVRFAHADEFIVSYSGGPAVSAHALSPLGAGFLYAFGTSDGSNVRQAVSTFDYEDPTHYVPGHRTLSSAASSARASASSAPIVALDTSERVTVVFGGKAAVTDLDPTDTISIIRQDGTVLNPSITSGFVPQAVAGHSMTPVNFGNEPGLFVFGGRAASGAMTSQAFLIRNVTENPARVGFADYEYAGVDRQGRAGHCAMLSSSQQINFFFGEDALGAYHFNTFLRIVNNDQLMWESALTDMGTYPSVEVAAPRAYAHCSVFAREWGDVLYSYGGRTQNGTYLSELWIFDLPTIVGPVFPSSRLPNAHVPVLAGGRALLRTGVPYNRLLLHGGETPDGLSGEVYVLAVTSQHDEGCWDYATLGNRISSLHTPWPASLQSCIRTQSGLADTAVWTAQQDASTSAAVCNCTLAHLAALDGYVIANPECDLAREDRARVDGWVLSSCSASNPLLRDCAELYIKTHHVWTTCAFNSTYADRCACAPSVMRQIGLDFHDFLHCPHIEHLSGAAFPCPRYQPPVCYLSGLEAIDICKETRGQAFAWTCDDPQLPSQDCPTGSVFDGVQCYRLCGEDERIGESIP